MSSVASQSQNPSPNPLSELQAWKLEDAKARFSEVVRLAREHHPQRITVRGQDAVVVLSAQEFAQLLPLMQQPNLHSLLSQSPLRHLDFEPSSLASSVRPVEL